MSAAKLEVVHNQPRHSFTVITALCSNASVKALYDEPILIISTEGPVEGETSSALGDSEIVPHECLRGILVGDSEVNAAGHFATVNKHRKLTMDWLMDTVEKDLGVDRRQQGPGPRARELIALVPTRWVTSLREMRLMRCARVDGVSEPEIRTFLQCSQAKLPPGWTRVCIQGLRKSKLGYRLARDPCHQQTEFTSGDSYVKTMQYVSQHNVR